MSEGDTLISVCMIVRDEEERLPCCLAAVRPLADELIVVDTGSTDRSREIVVGAGGRVLDVPWRKDFSKARNASLEAASSRWILVIDADEVLEPFDPSAFRRKLAASKEEALTIEIHSRLAGDGLSISHITRLFRNRSAYRYAGRVHEQIAPSIATWMGDEVLQRSRSGLVALHDGYLPEIRLARSKGERNEELLRAMVAEQPEDGNACFLLARELSQAVGSELLRTPRSREALELLDMAWEMLRQQRSAHVADLGLRRVRARILFGPQDGLEGLLDEHEDRFGASLLLHFARGELAFATPAKAADAVDHFRRALEIGTRVNAPLGEVDERYAHAWTLERIGRCQFAMGHVEDSRSTARDALEHSPSEAGPRILLASIALAEAQPHPALVHLVEAAKLAPFDPRPQLELARALASLGETDAAQRSLEAALRIAPGWEDALAPYGDAAQIQ